MFSIFRGAQNWQQYDSKMEGWKLAATGQVGSKKGAKMACRKMDGPAKWKVENWQQQGKWVSKRGQNWHGAKWRDENWHRPGGTLSATKNKDWSDFCISGLAQRVVIYIII